MLLLKLGLSRSSYYYQKKVQKRIDKYAGLREKIREIFFKSRQCYGYRRIYGLLRREGIILSEKVIRGQKENALKCKSNGGTRPLGYVIGENRHFEIDPLTAPYILEAYKKYDAGATITEIRDWMNEQGVRNTLGNPMTFNSVEHLLKNRRYIGEFKYRDVVIPDGIPAIVPKELFDSVQDKMEKNKKAPSRHKAEDDYLLTTKLYCGYCGAFMCGECGTSRSGATHHYYKCMSIKKRKKTCHKKTVKKQWIEDLVVHETMEMLTSDDRIDAIVSQIMKVQDRENTTLPFDRQHTSQLRNETRRNGKNIPKR